MTRVLVVVMVAALLGGCATGSPNMFSGKPVIQLDQGAFFVSYIKVSMAYAVFKYQMTEWCAAKAVPVATCANMAATDTMIQKIAEEINTSLQNPQYPIDMQKVQIFMDMVLSTLVKVGVKGITGGLVP
jgi:hypothetical protein